MPAGPWSGRRLHVVGVAGAGMSGLAVLAAGMGAEVTGSDRSESRYLDAVRAAGVVVRIGHEAANVPAGDDVEVVSSTAIGEENPERAEARRRGLPDRSRHRLLREVCAAHRVIAVAGAHGKTTTSAMVVHALRGAGEDPSFLVGGVLRDLGTGVHTGAGPWLVVEADESDRSFLETTPEIAIVTSVEPDHHATYPSRAALEEAFAAFLRQARDAVVWAGPELDALARAAATPRGAEGAGAEARADPPRVHRYDADPIPGPDGQRFAWEGREVVLAQPGRHLAWNAAAALTAAHLAGADPTAAAGAMAAFAGTGRRFEAVGRTPAGARVVDDYAHHPTEVARTLEAARALLPADGSGRVVACFQPHLFSRTRLLAREFGEALAAADLVCVLDVYPARERAEDHPGVDGLLVARACADAGAPSVLWTPTVDTAASVLGGRLRPEDVCLTLGAGDVDGVARALTG